MTSPSIYSPVDMTIDETGCLINKMNEVREGLTSNLDSFSLKFAAERERCEKEIIQEALDYHEWRITSELKLRGFIKAAEEEMEKKRKVIKKHDDAVSEWLQARAERDTRGDTLRATDIPA